jgi:nucleoside-diphosphate-sugar epimerase
MKVLFLGHQGYVGGVMVPALVRARPADEFWGYDSGLFSECLCTEGARPETVLDRQVAGDVRDLEPKHFKGFDAVVYLAAVSNDPMGKAFERATYEINRDAAVRTAELAKKAGVKKFVFASSCSVYGAGGTGAKNENSPLNPLTAYAKSKVEAEQLLLAHASAQFAVVCLRFATACGFSPRLRLDLIVNDFVACAMATGRIQILSDGTPWRPLIHLEDMARAVDWALGFSQDKYVVVNAGADANNFQVKEVAEAVASVLKDVDVQVNPDAAPDARSYRVDFGLFTKLAKPFTPKVTLSQAVEGLASGLKTMGFKDKDFRSGHLMRLKYLEHLRATNRIDELLRWRMARASAD